MVIVRIAELAAHVGVPVSSVRYYERIGLLPSPARTPAGYRDYDDQAATRLVFIHRSRNMGLTCDQIGDLLPIWDGTDCQAAHTRVSELIDEKRAEIAERIAELSSFSAQLDDARAQLEAAPPPQTCRTDLSCCMPDGPDAETVQVTLLTRKAETARHWPG